MSLGPAGHSPAYGEIAKLSKMHDEESDVVAAIARASNGKTCGGCASNIGGVCNTQTLGGRPVLINVAEAIACTNWKRRK